MLNSEAQPQTNGGGSRVCVLGTSNAVMEDGYVAQIVKEPTVRTLVNLSIGGSSSNLFTYRRQAIAAAGFDVVILDFCVNDTTLYTSRFQNLKNIEQTLEEMICSLNIMGSSPVLLMLPLQYYQNNPVPDIYRDVARRFSTPVFDGYIAANAICQAAGLGYDQLFENPFHLRRNLSQCLASWMMNSFGVYKQTLSAASDRQVDLATTRYVPVSEVSRPSLPQVARATSLIGETFSDIDDQTTIDLILPEGASIVAIVADFANSCGILCFSGSINLRICLSSLDLNERGDGLVLKAWPLPEPVYPHQGSVRMNVVSELKAGSDVSLNHPLSEAQKHMPVKIAIAGLIVRDPGRSTHNFSSRSRNVELTEIERDRFLGLAAEALR